MTTNGVPPTLLKGLNAVVTGTLQTQEFMRYVVQGAVEDVLLRVATEHGLNYTQLVETHRDSVVQNHTGVVDVQGGMCQGKNARNKPCSKPAVINGYCMLHAPQMCEDEADKRRVEAYQRKAINKSADPLGKLVREVARSDAFGPCFVSTVQSPLDFL
jgi:hypothetical protein